MYRKLFRMILAFALIMLGTATSYASSHEERQFTDYSKMEPSATLEFDVTSIKLIAGTSWGKGTLHYQGKAYPLKVRAITAGGIGYTEVKGVGNVYKMKSLEDFPGTYSGGTIGATAGNKATGRTTLENMKEVVLQLEVTNAEGLQLSASLGGVEISFDN